MVPGPTPLPPAVVAAGSEPIIYARAADFVAVWDEMMARLKHVFQTDGDVLVYAASGSGAMASALANLASPGDTVLVASCGHFGNRWVSIAKDHGVGVVHVEAEWGRQVSPDAVAQALAENAHISVVFTTQSETSTGAVNDLPALRRAVGDRILVVDAVSGLGVVDLPMDRWDIDVVVSGSQKGLMTPPGVAFVATSERALAYSAEHGAGGYYLGWERTRKGQNATPPRTAFTPPVTLVKQLNAALGHIEAEGLGAVFERHRVLGRACRAAVTALGLELLGPENPEANVVTSFRVPAGIDGKDVPKAMRARFGITIAGGQGKLSGEICRIGHCGYYAYGDIVTTVAALEIVLRDLGHPVALGTGLAAAQAVFASALS